MNIIPSQTAIEPILMHTRQGPLAELYTRDPSQSWITDSATSHSTAKALLDPLHGEVTAGSLNIPIALHSAVGGESDGPVPGDILCAALSSCMDSTLRVVANRLGITLKSVNICTSAEVDVRGTLCIDPTVVVGFQNIHLSVSIEAQPNTSDALIDALLNTAERCCVVMQTLKNPPTISTQFSKL
jgi:uncharacterized OsmC-like protein